jgi:hypothetical protein
MSESKLAIWQLYKMVAHALARQIIVSPQNNNLTPDQTEMKAAPGFWGELPPLSQEQVARIFATLVLRMHLADPPARETLDVVDQRS